MYDEDFLDWLYAMPVGFITQIWAQYNDRVDPPCLPTGGLRGDNFVFVAPTDQFYQKRLGEIDLIEQLLKDDKITLRDLIGR